MWSVEVHLDGCGTPLQLCVCDDAHMLAAVVLALASASETRPITLRMIGPPRGGPEEAMKPLPEGWK